MGLAAVLALAFPDAGFAASLSLEAFTQLSTDCAPRVAVETLAAVARTESAFNQLAINVNGPGGGLVRAGTREQAIALATELIVVNGRSVDLGLMQINSANLPRLGLTVTDAFDPCRSLAAAQRVLMEGYAAPPPGGDPQAALQQTLSRYNTGHPMRGLGREAGGNGYVTRVQSSAEVVVPAIRLRGDADAGNALAPLGGGAPVLVQPLPPPPASWDVYGQARAARGQGAVAYSPNRPMLAPAPAAQSAASATALTPAPNGPVQLRRLTDQQAANDAR